MEIKEILEGKKINDNLEDTSASDEAKVEGEGLVDEVPAEPAPEKPVPDLATSPIPTEEERQDAGLEGGEMGGSEEVINGESEPAPEMDAPVENVEQQEVVEENGVTELGPATKTFTQSQVNDMIGNTRTETREKTFRYIYDRYGVKDEAELDELVGNAQALDSFKEKYETERAGWKQTSADRDKELQDVKEQVALLQSGINNDRFEDAKFILRGKGLEVNLDNIKAELATHPEWQNLGGEGAGNPNFAKVGEPSIDTQKPAEPSSKISVLGNEAVGNPEGANTEEDYVMNRMFRV